MENIVKQFANIKQFNAYLENGEVQPAFKYYNSSQLTGSEKYKSCKTHDFKEANDLLMYGDKKTAKQIDDAGLAKIRANISRDMIHRQPYSSVVGFAANVPAYLAGSPNSMINIKQNKTKEKVVNIFYQVATSWTTPASSILQTSANFLSAVCKIEAGGLRVNVSCGFAVKNHRNTQQVTNVVKIKDSKEKLDVLKCAYPMVHPSMQRRHCFRFLEITEGVDGDMADGYGCVMRGKDIKTLLNENHCTCDCALGYNDICGDTVDMIIKRIEKQINEKQDK